MKLKRYRAPNMTGVDFVRKVRNLGDTEDIPLVMITSEKTISKIEEALDEAGANAFISKPFTVAELTFKLKKVIEKAQLNQIKKLRQEKKRQEQQAPAGGFWSKLLS